MIIELNNNNEQKNDSNTNYVKLIFKIRKIEVANQTKM